MQAGSEDPLRHHLDSIVIQAAATVAAGAGGRSAVRGDREADQGPDAEMTARFRSFADDGDSADGDGDRADR